MMHSVDDLVPVKIYSRISESRQKGYIYRSYLCRLTGQLQFDVVVASKDRQDLLTFGWDHQLGLFTGGPKQWLALENIPSNAWPVLVSRLFVIIKSS